MKTPDEIKKGLECCTTGNYLSCRKCPYEQDGCSEDENLKDALAYIQQLEAEKWELFDLLSSVWYGKGCYFKQDDGTVYSRASCKYLTFDQAIDEFANTLTTAQEV